MLNSSFAKLGLAITFASMLAACGSAPAPVAVVSEGSLEAQAQRAPTAVQKQQLVGQSRSVYRTGNGLLATNVSLTAADVAPALQRACLRGADTLTIKGQRVSLKTVTDAIGNVYDLSFPAMPSSAGARACLVTATGTSNLNTAVVGRGGWTSVNGAYPANDPDQPPVDLARAAAARSVNAYKVGLAVLAEDPSLTAPQVATALQGVCLQAFDALTVAGTSYGYGLPVAPAGLTSCTVEAAGDVDLKVTVTNANGQSVTNGQPTR